MVVWVFVSFVVVITFNFGWFAPVKHLHNLIVENLLPVVSKLMKNLPILPKHRNYLIIAICTVLIVIMMTSR